MRRCFYLLAMCLLCSSALAKDALNSGAVSVQLIATVAPEARLRAMPNGTLTVEQLADDRLRITLPPRVAVDVPFAVITNTHAAHLHAWTSGPEKTEVMLEIVPVNTDCDWVHAPVGIQRHRVVAALAGCKPSMNQAGAVKLRSGDFDVSIVLMAEPVFR